MSGPNEKPINQEEQLTGSIYRRRTILSGTLSALPGSPDGMPHQQPNPSVQDNLDSQEIMEADHPLRQGEIVGKLPETLNVAIIGTRKPDCQQTEAAFHLSWVLACMLKCTIKTGGAEGIDQIVMEGTRGTNLKVYLPWACYNREIIPPTAETIIYNPTIHGDWKDSVFRYHPTPHNLSGGDIALHARNFGIVSGTLGVIAFPNELGGGGTAQGIRIAKALGIPCLEGRKGQIIKPAAFISSALKLLKLVDPSLKPAISGIYEQHIR